MGNEGNVSEDESILALIYESSTEDDCDDGYISTNTFDDIRDENYVNPDNNARDDRLKIRDSTN